jgi:hypothetical protein
VGPDSEAVRSGATWWEVEDYRTVCGIHTVHLRGYLEGATDLTWYENSGTEAPLVEGICIPPESEEREAQKLQSFTGKEGSGCATMDGDTVGILRSLSCWSDCAWEVPRTWADWEPNWKDRGYGSESTWGRDGNYAKSSAICPRLVTTFDISLTGAHSSAFVQLVRIELSLSRRISDQRRE